jgi:hypothetical protein
MLILLLREALLAWINSYITRPDRGTLSANGRECDVTEMDRLLRATLQFKTHAADRWSVAGRRLGNADNSENFPSIPATLQSLYSWNVLSWGADFTGLMVALVTADAAIIEEAKLKLAELGCNDLIVSEYGTSDIRDGKFRGVIFNRVKEDRGKGIWKYISHPKNSVLAFTRGAIPSRLVEVNEIVAIEDGPKDYGRGMCLRVREEREFLELARENVELMISDSSFNSFANRGMASFSRLQEDPLLFAINEFRTSEIVYVTGTARRHQEIIIGCNEDASRISNDEDIKRSGMYEFRCFC